MERIHEYDSIESALAGFKSFNSKLKELYKQNPCFWFSVNLEGTDSEGYKVFINSGKLIKFDFNGGDLEMPGIFN